jgi:hypothetical protein
MSDDLLDSLRKHAERLDAVCDPEASPVVFYEVMSGGLVWGDELMVDEKFPPEVFHALRTLWAYRTSVIVAAPEEKWRPHWEACTALFPRWIGFRPERSKASPELLRILKRGKRRLAQQLKMCD